MTAGVVADTTPYPWPYDGEVDPSRLALVVAGHDASWASRAPDVEDVSWRVDRLSVALREAGVLVLRVVHRTGREDPGVPPGLLAFDPAVTVVVAAGTDAFFGSDLDHLLRAEGRDHLLLAGFGLEAPIHSTMRSANDRGYECLLLLDACAPLDPTLTSAARSMIEMSGGIFGAVGSVSPLLAALDLPPLVPDTPPEVLT